MIIVLPLFLLSMAVSKSHPASREKPAPSKDLIPTQPEYSAMNLWPGYLDSFGRTEGHIALVRRPSRRVGIVDAKNHCFMQITFRRFRPSTREVDTFSMIEMKAESNNNNNRRA